MKRRYRIVVVGAGVTGLSFAGLLAKSAAADALDIRVLDGGSPPRPPPGDEVALRVSALANGSTAILERAGAWPLSSGAPAAAFDAMQVWDEDDAPDSATALFFDAAEFALPQLGFIVENERLRAALLDALGDAVDIDFDAHIDSLPEADLVVGADGARSATRRLAGIMTRDWPYEQVAFVTHLRPELAHGNVARQRFLRAGPLGMLPLADGRISIVWSTTPEVAREALEADDDALGRRLTDASGGILGRLNVAAPRASFPLHARHARQYVQRGLALIGDAAHTIHPLAGQGANLGLQDAAALAAVVETAVLGGQHPGDRPVLRRYERARKGANGSMLHLMTGLNRLFATDSPLVRELRTAGMQLFNDSGPVRSKAVQVALGAGREAGRR